MHVSKRSKFGRSKNVLIKGFKFLLYLKGPNLEQNLNLDFLQIHVCNRSEFGLSNNIHVTQSKFSFYIKDPKFGLFK